MEETILTTCKRNISGIEPDNHDFDLELLDHINSIFRVLNRYGIGKESFCATVNSVWSDFLDAKTDYYSMVKTYIPLKVKLFWDPPTVGSAVEALKEAVKEMEFDLMVRRECPNSFAEEDDE